MVEWKKSLTQVALLVSFVTKVFSLMTSWSRQTGAAVISLGYANFIIIPCADIFGRRIVSIVCALICLGANIWQASAQSYNSFLGARVFAGLGAAANESIMTVVVADIFFLHQRGKYVGLYLYVTSSPPLQTGSCSLNEIAVAISWAYSLVLSFPDQLQRKYPGDGSFGHAQLRRVSI
jgi:MFS family permease